MPYYESVFIARQDVSSQQVETLADELSAVVANGGGKVTKRENWGLRNLAYRMNKNRKGHYILLNLDSPSDAVREMERQMRLNEDILRYMTIRLDALDAEPSVMMQKGRDRDERGPRGGGRFDRDDRGPRGGGRFERPSRGSNDDAEQADEGDAE